jgi:hypothetical protein
MKFGDLLTAQREITNDVMKATRFREHWGGRRVFDELIPINADYNGSQMALCTVHDNGKKFVMLGSYQQHTYNILVLFSRNEDGTLVAKEVGFKDRLPAQIHALAAEMLPISQIPELAPPAGNKAMFNIVTIAFMAAMALFVCLNVSAELVPHIYILHDKCLAVYRWIIVAHIVKFAWIISFGNPALHGEWNIHVAFSRFCTELAIFCLEFLLVSYAFALCNCIVGAFWTTGHIEFGPPRQFWVYYPILKAVMTVLGSFLDCRRINA